ncbi:GH12547 [Drosophila grimshawi]|uniref:GH12547 n=1 Tax=Drosophila grimshawi TaxID=7222 RepID=B4JJV4_DROGR|nr:GH12547 [Drosophila grimshawi]
MEPPGGLPPDRDQQLVLRNLVNATPSTSATVQQAQSQPLPPEQLVQIPQCVKPTTLSLQPLIAPQATAQLFPSTQINNNLGTIATLTSYAGGHSGSSPALASAATTINAATQAATAFSGSSMGHHHPQHHHHLHQHQAASVGSNASQHHHHQGSASTAPISAGAPIQQPAQQTIDKLSRPMAFDKMEVLVREMQDQEHGVPVRQQKMFLTSIPYAFMGYDLIEWLMDRLQIEESEALNIANQLCLHGYFFPVNDSKTLTVKDDSSLYRFQTPYYWPWQHKAPDNVEYAIYLAKRSLRNKQRHALEDYEAEALASLHKNLKGKWDFISMQAEEQVRLAKERKKGEKIVGDSQERAYWRVHRPPPGQFTPLEPCPVPSRDRQGQKPNKKKTVDDIQREVEFLSKSLNRTRMKMSQACESLVCYSETFNEYDFFLQPALPSNPWVTEDIAFWQLNSTFVDIPTEKRVKRWAISIEELVSDPTGLQEFTNFLEKEYSHENIRFWIAVNRLRRSAHSQVARKVNEIFEEFLKPGAPCEINIDGKTMESVLRGLKNPTRFTFDSASEHIYMLLLKKDCYPRFVRSDFYKRLVDSGIQPSHKKRFFNFGGVSGAKKKMTAALSSQPNLGEAARGTSSTGTASGTASIIQAPPPNSIARRRGSDRSLTGSAHELAVGGVTKDSSKVPHSHSQNNLSEISYR